LPEKRAVSPRWFAARLFITILSKVDSKIAPKIVGLISDQLKFSLAFKREVL